MVSGRADGGNETSSRPQRSPEPPAEPGGDCEAVTRASQMPAGAGLRRATCYLSSVLAVYAPEIPANVRKYSPASTSPVRANHLGRRAGGSSVRFT